ncbi:MAG: dihydrodipicolinate synthase family protein [Acidimicrobiales bacterium]
MPLARLEAGAQGAVVASANVAPELSCRVHRAGREGDLAGAVSLGRRLRQLVALCPVGGFPGGWKAAGVAVERAQPPDRLRALGLRAVDR